MSKNKIYLFVLTVLLSVSVWFWLKKSNTQKRGNFTEFRLSDPSSVTEIRITQAGKTLNLAKTDSGWLVDKHFPARKNAVVFLLKTLSKMQMRFPAPELVRNKVIEQIMEQGSEVFIEIKNDQNKHFFVGGQTPDGDGTYLVSAGFKQVFVVSLPGKAGHISHHFLPEKMAYMQNYIFPTTTKPVSVTVDYLQNPTRSFSLMKQQDTFVLKGINDNFEVQTATVSHYLALFGSVCFTENRNSGAQEQGSPLHQIKAAYADHEPIILSTYAVFSMQGTQKIEDFSKVFATINGADKGFFIPYSQLDKILKKASYFAE